MEMIEEASTFPNAVNPVSETVSMEVDSQETPSVKDKTEPDANPPLEIPKDEEKKSQTNGLPLPKSRCYFPKPRRTQKKVEEIKKEIQMLYQNEHPEFLDQVKAIESRKKEKIWISELWRNYQLECVEKLYRAEKVQAEDEYESEKGLLKEKLVSELVEKRKNLLSEKDIEGSQEANGEAQRQAARKLRKRGEGPDVGRPSKKKQQQNDILFYF